MHLNYIVLLLFSFFSLSLSTYKSEIGIFERVLNEETCSRNLLTVLNSKIIEFATNCNNSKSNIYVKTNEEYVLKDACLLANNMLYELCQRNDIKFDLLPLNVDKICPINFFNISSSGQNKFLKLKELLSNETYCSRICYDLDLIQGQCFSLAKINDLYLMLNKKTTTTTTQSNKETDDIIINTDLNENPQESTNKVNNVNTEKLQNKTTTISGTNYEKINNTLQSQSGLNEDQTLKIGDSIQTPSSSSSLLLLENKNYPKTIETLPQDNSPLNNQNQESDNTYEKKTTFIPARVYNKAQFRDNEDFDNSNINIDTYSKERFFQAFALEGKSNRRNRRRPNTNSYKKLESSLEEAIVSNAPHGSETNIVY
ncbi:hypothetical protein Phum_PHUM376520 [Pediculus humanus corporis]|uniref:Secreted ookinete protein n=1 Tax=Pediculus humanus subsp. corporis TaxID=121224 RepID=E0VQD9_PEDHC|nr:uncharacterized protein Phum_PHUM376520 [Pediculus humanus corporis]EEB15595.1 hypothetical protein Phum_PHUM376520 [Pediculus humanus corporis]